jgi:hypothetical protein
MPAFGERLTEVERWQAITDIRSFAAGQSSPAPTGGGGGAS